MKKHIKELSTSDVMVVLIQQEQTPDRIDHLRQHFTYTQQTIQQVTNAQEIILLPEFATQPLSEQEILAHHLIKHHSSEAHILNYRSLLDGIDQQMKKVIEKSTQDCLLSNQIIHELKLKLEQTCSLVTLQRKPVSQLLQHFQSKYLAIARKMLVISNMQKTLDVMKFWKETKVSSVITIQPDKIHTYSDIQSILQSFDQIKLAISAKKEQFSHFGNLVGLVTERKKALLRTIYLNALNCIITYSNDAELASKLDQFQYISTGGLLQEIKDSKLSLVAEDVSKEEYFVKMIDENIQEMYRLSLLKKNSTVAQSLKEDAFVQFYQCLTLEYSRYFSNWHKVTTFHMQHNHPVKEQFIKNRTLVFNKMMERIEYALKFSGKLQSLGLFRLNKLFRCLTNFMQFGEQWMGKCRTNLRTLIKEKIETETINFSKTKNGEIRRLLLQEFTKTSYFDFQKNKQAVLLELWELFNQVKRYRESSEDNKADQQSIRLVEYQTLQEDISKYYQRLHSRFSMNMFRIITQYRFRQEQVSSPSQLSLLYQHFQFVISMLYRTFVPSYMRQQFQNQTFSQTFRSQKINSASSAVSKNSIDQQTILAVNKLRHNFTDRNNFGYLFDFITQLNNRYQPLTLSPSATQMFNESDRYEQELCDMSVGFLSIANQVYALLEYVQHIISQSAFTPRQEQLQQRFSTLKQVVLALVLHYFTSFYQNALKKYYSQVMPIFTSIKFEVKRKNDIMVGLRDYRSKLAQIYNRFAIYRTTPNNCFNSVIFIKQNEYFYKFVIDMFSRIEKINDDARQILKQEPAQLHKITGIDKNSCAADSWPCLIEFYLQISKERNSKVLQEAVQRTAVVFPVQWWKSSLSWFYNDCSSKQKKQFFLKVVQIYLNRLINLPRI